MNTPGFVQVLIPPLHQPFTYEVPQELASQVSVGSRVIVPFGRRKASGFVIEQLTHRPKNTSAKPFEIKKIDQSEWSYPHFLESQLKLFQWIADYYQTSLASVLELAVPPAVVQKFDRVVRLLPCASLANEGLGSLATRILAHIKESGGNAPYSELSKKFKNISATLKRLSADSLVEILSREVIDQHVSLDAAPQWAKGAVELNAEQKTAVDLVNASISQREFKGFLLHGVTGSGKTEVYIDCIRHACEQGLGALVIVPEIALTPQLIDRFRARLGSDLATLHSGLPPRVRWDSWRALLEGRCAIAIGARSAVFAPVPKLGVVIVDEEHDSSYKQSEGLRYNARDIALVRGKLENCPVVLGSATPALETFHHALSKKYHYISLPTRHAVSKNLDIEIVDLHKVKPWEMSSKNVSPTLKEAIADTVAAGNQAFILYNRRGFASYLQCEKCEHVLECPNCSVTLTYHQHRHTLMCHYCNLTMIPPEYCLRCSQLMAATEGGGSNDGAAKVPGKFEQRGAGTEKIYEEIKELFPNVGIDRLDRDAVTDLDHYRAILDRVRRGETQILVGTQMIAKGHDLPGVTLVGVADCDVGLHMPDFRAGERIFQLLTQASGRAGRAEKPGRVILQTRAPKHSSLVHTVTKDYCGFAQAELKSRSQLEYPPFTRMARITSSAVDQDLALKVLTELRQHLGMFCQKSGISLSILGPSACPIQKIKTLWRFHLLLKSKSASQLLKVVREMQQLNLAPQSVRLIFDVDPQEMM